MEFNKESDNRLSFPLYINILTMFFLLILTVTGAVIFYNYIMNERSALQTADRLLSEVSQSVMERTQAVFQPAFMAVDTYACSSDMEEKATLLTHPLAPMFFRTLSQNPNFTSLYMGFADGDFFMVTNLKGRDSARKAIKAPKGAIWYTLSIFHRHDGSRFALNKYLNADCALMDSSLENAPPYDPRKRPWYKAAIGTDKATLSDVYFYAFDKEPGISVSQRFDGDVEGVFAVDISLSKISGFLGRQNISQDSRIILFAPDGHILAHPDAQRMVKIKEEDGKKKVTLARINDLEDPVLDGILSTFRDAGEQPFTRGIFRANGEEYLAHVAVMPSQHGKEVHIGMAVPMREFTGPIVRAGKQSVFFSVLLLAGFIPVIVWTSRRITKPLNQIMSAVRHIRQFELDERVPVRSRINEINRLAQAMETMRVALKSFGMYIPDALVKNIVTSNLSPELGGDRKELTLFFSDIADFTTLAESLSPEALTNDITRYFDEVGSVILSSGGTIDKYIGDAIMAFWNAPTEQADHASQACLTALRCRAAVHTFNAARQKQGLLPMHTRFGLHTGEAIVGNTGSSDRMNYTAMGASVNLASRIEGLNKHYGTEILVSQNTMAKTGKGFVFRSVGRAIPKGSKESVGIFELVGTRGGAMHGGDEFAVDDQTSEFLSRWEKTFKLYLSRRFAEAAERFEKHLADRPQDGLAAMYLTSARNLAAIPPPPGWQGVTTFTTK